MRGLNNMEKLRNKKAFICDMDGVIYHGNRLLPGVKDFVEWLKENGKQFLFLTNASEWSLPELQQKLQRLGITVDVSRFYTSALATASFLSVHKPGGTAYVIGEAGLTNALYEAGYSMNDINPDYVVVGETRSYSFEKLEKAINMVMDGAKLVGTNPMMMRHALRHLGCRREDTAIIGDRMDTDIIAGINSDIDTVLVLSGVTSREDLQTFAYHPRYILEGVIDIPG